MIVKLGSETPIRTAATYSRVGDVIQMSQYNQNFMVMRAPRQSPAKAIKEKFRKTQLEREEVGA